MSRGGKLTEIEDHTSLNGPDIDVASRIAWLVRMARTTSDVPGSSRLEDFARAIGTNKSRVQRMEVGAQRDGWLINAYEDQLALPSGSLRAAVDATCRTFPASCPKDRAPAPRAMTVADTSRLTERLLIDLQGETCSASGGEWLAWAQSLARPGAVGLPESIGTQLISKLISQLSRSVAAAYVTRYEALALMRCSEYGHLVIEVAREKLRDPHIQVLNDLMSAVGEIASTDAVDWCLELLTDSRPSVVTGAVVAIENMATISMRPQFWTPISLQILQIYNAVAPGSLQWQWLSHLLRLMPPSLLRGLGARIRQPLAPSPQIVNWSTTRLNVHWSQCEERSLEITSALDVDPQPILTRLLFDIALSPHETRAVTSGMLVAALPVLRRPVSRHIAEMANTHEGAGIQDRAARRLAVVQFGDLPEGAADWRASGNPVVCRSGLHLAGLASIGLAAGEWERLLADEVTLRPTLFALGMAGHPALSQIATDPNLGSEVRGGARWWLREGPRIVA